MPDVDFLVARDHFASGPSLTADVLATANLVVTRGGLGAAPFRWRVLTEDGGPARSQSGLLLASEGRWADARAELRMVFGVGMADDAVILGALTTAEGRALTREVAAGHDSGATLLASCSSTFFLAETGRLTGGPATTSWWLAPLFRRRYPRVELRAEDLVTEHERIVCAGAAMSQLDLALHVVRSSCGLDVARACARFLVIDDARASQAPFLLVDHLGGHDELVARAQRHVREHLRGPFDLDDLARAVGASPRTLRRRFAAATGMSPARYVQRARAEAAANLLRATDRSIAEIALEVGYAEDGALRRAFREHFDASPREWRDRGR